MGYDVQLADRVRALLADQDGIAEKAMFGGLAFLVHGNMAVAASSEGGLMVRADPARSAELVAERGARRMVMRGRELDGWLRIDGQLLAGPGELEWWVGLGTRYALSLPLKG